MRAGSMKKIRHFVFAVATGASLSACKSREKPTHTVVWTQSAGAPPATFSSNQFATPERTLLSQGELVTFSKQYWGLAAVEGGSLLTIEDASGKLLYGKAKFETSPDLRPSIPDSELKLLDQNRSQFLESLKNKNILPRKWKLLSQPEVVIHITPSRPVACYAIDVLNPTRHSVERYLISPKFKILESDEISSDFDAPAWIFTLESATQIQEVWLKSLIDGPAVQSTVLQVLSQAPNPASQKDSPWRFPSDDPRFDQVQAYYFLTLGIEHFAKDLGFTIPMQVQAETYESYPDKVNAAFTYDNQIRIGYGDGVAYKGLARDPSVVIHELGHVVTGVIAHLPTQKEGGSINEAFADFFSASYLNDPKMGNLSNLKAPYTRNLEDFIPFASKNGGLYHDSQIVSGTLWQIRSALGASTTQKLAMRTLARLGPATSLLEFPPALRLAATDLAPDQIGAINGILKKYGWPEQN